MASLRAAGHETWLLAPAASGSALVGPGPSEAAGLIPWDRPDLAPLLSQGGLGPGPLRDELAAFDAAIVYTRTPALVEGLRGVIARVLDHDPLPPPEASHASAWFADPVWRLGVPRVRQVPLLVPTEEEGEAARPWLGRLPDDFFAVHPGSGSLAKTWPADRFAALVERVVPRSPFLLVEGPADAAATSRLARLPRAVVARSLPVRTLGAILARAGVTVGNDSGVTHLAAAYGVRTVALFGPTDAGMWGPLGPRVTIVRSPSRDMVGIDVKEVVAAVGGTSSSTSPPARPSG